MKSLFWTKSKARLKLFHRNSDKNYNWLFLPGGPGLGSESLRDLAEILNLPGSMWFLDLPGDGSNIINHEANDFANWSPALLEATSEFDKVILVAHSSGGMFALATPELEKNLIGLVLMSSAPSASWQNHFMHYVKEHPIPDAERLQILYEKEPSNDLLKKLTMACSPYFSRADGLQKMITLLNSLPFNYESHAWAANNFDSTYEAKWIPKHIPTMIFAGDEDHITPLHLFYETSDFQRENIVISEIKNAAHFPWLDQPHKVKELFAMYSQQLDSLNL